MGSVWSLSHYDVTANKAQMQVASRRSVIGNVKKRETWSQKSLYEKENIVIEDCR